MTPTAASIAGAPERVPRGPRGTWFALVAGPLAWLLQELLGWFVGARICAALPVTAVRLIVAAVSVAALGVTVAAGTAGWRNLRAAPDGGGPLVDTAERTTFLSLAGVLVSGVFALGIVWAGLSAAFLDVCGWAR